MGPAALAIKLRCASWDQLAVLHRRDLKRGALFLRTGTPPAVGTELRVDLTLPSGSVVALVGTVTQQVARGPSGAGVELALVKVPPSTMWLIESALESARQAQPEPEPDPKVTVVEAPPAEEERDAGAAELELVQALEAELASLRALNPFQALGVAYQAGDGEVEAAFAELSKKVHPDRFARYESERARALASEIFIILLEAHRKLADAATRGATLAALRRPAPARLSADELFGDLEGLEEAEPPPAFAEDPPAETAAAARHLDAGRYDEALAAYEAIVRARPTDPEGRAGRALAQGFKALAEGDRTTAAARFDAALEVDPLNERAARELAGLRRSATESRKGLLGKLLGRKA